MSREGNSVLTTADGGEVTSKEAAVVKNYKTKGKEKLHRQPIEVTKSSSQKIGIYELKCNLVQKKKKIVAMQYL